MENKLLVKYVGIVAKFVEYYNPYVKTIVLEEDTIEIVMVGDISIIISATDDNRFSVDGLDKYKEFDTVPKVFAAVDVLLKMNDLWESYELVVSDKI